MNFVKDILKYLPSFRKKNHFLRHSMAHQPLSCRNLTHSKPLFSSANRTSVSLSSIIPETTSRPPSLMYPPISGDILIIISATILAVTISYFLPSFIFTEERRSETKQSISQLFLSAFSFSVFTATGSISHAAQYSAPSFDAQIARINDLQDYIKQQRTDLAEFDETLVKRWLKQIIVWEDHFTMALKSGLKIDIED